MIDSMKFPAISVEVAHRRRGVRLAIKERHKTPEGLAYIRLANLWDWTNRLMTKKQQLLGKEHKEAQFKGFFNYELDNDQKAACKAFMREDEEIMLLIEEAIASGYKITVALNPKNGSLTASMQQKWSGEANAGMCMTAHAKHWYDAVAVLVFKHYKVLQGRWEKESVPEDEDFG